MSKKQEFLDANDGPGVTKTPHLGCLTCQGLRFYLLEQGDWHCMSCHPKKKGMRVVAWYRRTSE